MRASAFRTVFSRPAAACLLAALLLAGCSKDESPVKPTGDPETFRHLEVTYLRGSLRFHLNASLPNSERYSAEIALLLKNTDSIKEFSGLTMPYANLYVHANLLPLGTIPLRTDWDGSLGALRSDTVLLRNDSLRQGIIDARCGQLVFFEIRLAADPSNSELIPTDSLLFECIQ